jgi:hypothetical protein
MPAAKGSARTPLGPIHMLIIFLELNLNKRGKVETACNVKLRKCVEAYWPTLVELVHIYVVKFEVFLLVQPHRKQKTNMKSTYFLRTSVLYSPHLANIFSKI